MTIATTAGQDRQWLDLLADMPEQAVRREYLLRRRELCTRESVEQLADASAERGRANLDQADRLAQTAEWLADYLNDDYCRARSLRARGHMHTLRGEYTDAVRAYHSAVELFHHSPETRRDAAITQSGALLALIYTGGYTEAEKWATEARAVFEAVGDKLRLARLDTNVANIYYRQDRFADALSWYEAALESLRETGTPQDIAVALRNLAVCHISLSNFPEALAAYREARALAEHHHLPVLALENDYNIAYLHYLRGEYTRAIELYNGTRVQCLQHGDRYHGALCDLDQSELYLELNLADEGSELAASALKTFEQLGMRYEAAKALANLAIAASQHGRFGRARRLFAEARGRFVLEENAIWPAVIDLYDALVLLEQEKFTEAERGAEAAHAVFVGTPLGSKVALARMIAARARLGAGDLDGAERWIAGALEALESWEAPMLLHQALFVQGQIRERRGDMLAARKSYIASHAAMERLRTHLAGDELKIAFLKNKLGVFESLFALLLADGDGGDGAREAFAYMEQAKSRSLADLISFRAHALPAPGRARGDLVDRVRQLRGELNWYYHRLHQAQLARELSKPQIDELRHSTQKRERELIKALGELRGADQDYSSVQHGTALELDAVQASLPAGTVLLEYYAARGTLYGFAISRDDVTVRPLAPLADVRREMGLLRLQLSKFRFGDGYLNKFGKALEQNVRARMGALHDIVVAPLAKALSGEHVVVVPHDVLHQLPFHALYDGNEHLIDRFTVSYAPSATVLHLCMVRPPSPAQMALVLGVPDANAPSIAAEVQAVAGALPGARLYVGDDATEERLRTEGKDARIIHVAAHAVFRQDNPMFSSIRLGSSHLTLFDLYRLELDADLVVLSGCGTGLHSVVGGDELLGLSRGFLYAGARSLLLSLWEVSDRVTADFMRRFYDEAVRQPGLPGAAVRSAMLAIREENPHPYYWAPFSLIGQFRRPPSIKPGAVALL